jgi:hypothetical protein
VVDNDGTSSAAIARAIRAAKIEVQYCPTAEFPTKLSDLMDVDAVVLANCPCGDFTANQQDMLARYVERMGGGLVMTGGPNGFGAGGWIGSPVAAILPVDLDPKQKKQLPKGALVMVMHPGRGQGAVGPGSGGRAGLLLERQRQRPLGVPAVGRGRPQHGHHRHQPDADGRHARFRRAHAGGV